MIGKNDTALITGASSGIGEAFAVELADRGVNLVLVARRGDKLESLRSRLLLQFSHIAVDVVVADLSVAGSAKDLVAQVGTLGRNITILINNAGVGLHGEFSTQNAEENSSQIQLNCLTLVELTAAFLPSMLASSRGLVLNVASVAAFQPAPGMAVYGATKAFVLSFTEALWQETKSSAVRILTLCPGATETEFFTRTGEEFLTSGRQTPVQVVRTALRAIDTTKPTVVSGWRNKLLASSYRFAPRQVNLAIAERIMKAH